MNKSNFTISDIITIALSSIIINIVLLYTSTLSLTTKIAIAILLLLYIVISTISMYIIYLYNKG